jgi:lipopolysaccharide transport system ATP-binding protein
MSDIAVEVNRVSKKFHRGELHDSLRDLVPALAKRLFRRGPNPAELSEGDFWAVRDVSFQVKKGEVLGIIGPNGAGKSTLLKILSKIIKPTRGSIQVNGRLRALIEVAAGFHGDLTGRENIYLNGSILGMKKREIDKKFAEIVDFSGIEPFLDTPVKRYSSGMYARLGFAVAAHLDPDVLIVDEVLAVGDTEFQKKCLGKMGNVAREGRTVLFVSHNMQAVTNLCHRTFLLDKGTLRYEGDPRTAVDRYLRAAGEGETDSAEQVWKLDGAPGDHITRLRAVRALNDQGETSWNHDIARPITIEIEFWLLQSCPSVDVSFHLYNQDGVCLFAVGHGLGDHRGDGGVKPGLYRVAGQIPGSFLNDGLHRVSAFLVQNKMQLAVHVPHAISFNVQDYGDNRGGFLGKIIGAVRPILPWTTHYVEDLQ